MRKCQGSVSSISISIKNFLTIMLRLDCPTARNILFSFFAKKKTRCRRIISHGIFKNHLRIGTEFLGGRGQRVGFRGSFIRNRYRWDSEWGVRWSLVPASFCHLVPDPIQHNHVVPGPRSQISRYLDALVPGPNWNSVKGPGPKCYGPWSLWPPSRVYTLVRNRI